MVIGDRVRATYPYGGVPAGAGEVIRKLFLGKRTELLVRFEVRPQVYKEFYFTERELTPCPVPATLDG